MTATSPVVPARTVVHLLRHGEVENPDAVIYGRLAGFHLSVAGEAMAERAALALAGADVTVLISSPLERAVQTAQPVAAQFGLDVVIDPRLIEPTSVFEGARFGVGHGALLRPANWRYLRNPFRPSWGEPYVEVAARMMAAIESARDAARGHEAVCVSHQLPIWTARLRVEGKRLWHDPRRRQCALGSITSITFEGDRVVGVGYREPSGKVGLGQVGGA